MKIFSPDWLNSYTLGPGICIGRSGRRLRDDKKIELERFSLTISKPFDQVVAALYAVFGRPSMADFLRSTHEARSFAELKMLQVAQDLDKKVEDLLKQAAA